MRVYDEHADWLLTYRLSSHEGFWSRQLEDPEKRTVQATYYETVPAHPKVVFYESMSGQKVMDSPYAIFQRARQDSRFHGHLHVWSANSTDNVPRHLLDQEDVLIVRRGTEAYYYLLARAGHIIGNSVLPPEFVRRADQKYLNTWHGIPYKLIGRSEKAPLGAGGSVQNMLQATHVLSPCEFATDRLISAFSMRGTFTGEMAEIGYPRIDQTINISADEKERLETVLGLHPDKPTILYAPTWRGRKGRSDFDADQLTEDLRALQGLDANVIFLGHHIMKSHIETVDFAGVVVPPENANSNELLALADVLISDYSSIFFDFLVTGRPIVHYLYDYEQYQAVRGLSLQLEELPGDIVMSRESLLRHLESLLVQEHVPGERYRRALERFCPHDDGKAAERAVEWFFFHERPAIIRDLRTPGTSVAAFWGGRLGDDALTAEYLDELRRCVAETEGSVVLFVSRAVARNEAVLKTLGDLGDDVTVVARSNFEMSLTPDEAQAKQRLAAARNRAAQPLTSDGPLAAFKRRVRALRAWIRRAEVVHEPAVDGIDDLADEQMLEAAYLREYRRIFGDARFDQIIPHPGLTSFWKELSKHALR